MNDIYGVSIYCELCKSSMDVGDWPAHRDTHIAEARAFPENVKERFCHVAYTGNEVISCRRKKGHAGLHAGPLGELKW